MAAVIPAIGTLFGVGSATAATASTLSTVGTVLSASSAALGVVSSYTSAKATKQGLEDQAAQEEANAASVREAGNIKAQDADFDALVQIGEAESSMAGSGFFLGSKTSMRQRRLNRLSARRNSLRIIDDSERQAVAADQRAASARSSAAGISPFFAGITSAIAGTSSLISSATAINPKTQMRITKTAQG